MNILKGTTTLLSIGAIQTFIAHSLGLHGDLEHMQYTHWGQYAGEAVFYAIFWAIIYNWLLKTK